MNDEQENLLRRILKTLGDIEGLLFFILVALIVIAYKSCTSR